MELAKVLLVDDESDVTRILSKRLGRRGYECQSAANGQQAVDAMEQFPFGIVIMDVKMPGYGWHGPPCRLFIPDGLKLR